MNTQQITLSTPQNVNISYPLASLGQRAGAFLLDSFFFVICGVLLVLIFSDFLEGIGYRAIQMLLTYFPFLIFIALKSVLEVNWEAQTPGKKILGIRVVRLDHKPLSLGDAFIRNVIMVLEVILSSGVIAALAVSANARRQRLGDLVALTVVISKTDLSRNFTLNDILKLNQQYSDEKIVYRQAVLLQESDMLFVKQLLALMQSEGNFKHDAVAQQLAAKLASELGISPQPHHYTVFLKQLLTDYIVLTRS
jgi:uncharacterized RDD family membrane protein YckC